LCVYVCVRERQRQIQREGEGERERESSEQLCTLSYVCRSFLPVRCLTDDHFSHLVGTA
jgi:hypothetical protein